MTELPRLLIRSRRQARLRRRGAAALAIRALALSPGGRVESICTNVFPDRILCLTDFLLYVWKVPTVRKSVSRIVRLAQPVRKSIVSPLRRALATTADFIAPRTYRHFRLVHQLTSFCRRNSNLDDPIVSILTRPGGNAKWHLVAITRKSNQLSFHAWTSRVSKTRTNFMSGLARFFE